MHLLKDSQNKYLLSTNLEAFRRNSLGNVTWGKEAQIQGKLDPEKSLNIQRKEMATYFRAEFHINLNSVEVDDSQLDYPTQNPVIDGAVEEFLANEKMGENILYPMTQLSYILDQEYTVILSYSDEVTVEGFKDLLYGASPDGNAPDGWMEGNLVIGPFSDGDEYEIIPTLSHLWQYVDQIRCSGNPFDEKDWVEIDLHALQPTLY